VTVKKLGYKYIVEDICCGCGHAQINRASTEALQYAKRQPSGSWQPLDEPPSLVALPRPTKNDNPVRTVSHSEAQIEADSTSTLRPPTISPKIFPW
jgi:hypothetical protein